MLILSLCASTVGGADAWRLPPETARFKPGRGAELATSCLLCHSADKMRVKYGAPIATNQVDQLVEYLTATYGARPK
jgi:hypothetical protein